MSRFGRLIVALFVACSLPGVALVAARGREAVGQQDAAQKTGDVKASGKATSKQVAAKVEDQAGAKVAEKVEVRVEMKAMLIQANPNAVAPPPFKGAKAAFKGAKAAEPNLDRMIQQFLPQLRPYMKGEVHLIVAVCKPSKEQKAAIDREGEVVLRAATKAYAAFQHKIQNVGWDNNDKQPNPKLLVAEGMLAAVTAQLTPEQAGLYKAEVDKRAAATRRMTARNLVANLDEDLVLDAAQRQKLFDSLVANWDDKWGAGIENLLYGNNMFPNVPDKLVGPFLTPIQKKIWDRKPKNQMFFMGNNFMNGNNAAIDEDGPPAVPVPAAFEAAAPAPAVPAPPRPIFGAPAPAAAVAAPAPAPKAQAKPD